MAPNIVPCVRRLIEAGDDLHVARLGLIGAQDHMRSIVEDGCLEFVFGT
jgi:hypothetical protein